MDLGSSSSSSDTEAEGGDAPAPGQASSSQTAAARKRKGKARLMLPPSDDDDSDISEYEEEPKAAPGPGGKQAESSSSDDLDDAEATEESDGPGEEPEYEGDYASEGSDRSRGGRGNEPILKVKGVKAAPPRPRVSVATSANPSKPKPQARRVPPPDSHPPTLIDHPFATVGPQYEPPVRKLSKNARSVVEGEVEQRNEEADDGLRMRLLEAWAVTPFGPEKGLLQDMGWWKGKWDAKKGQRSRWGGWYEEVKAEMGVRLNEE